MPSPRDNVRLMRERFDTRVDVSLQATLVVNGESVPCMTDNVSLGGLFLLTDVRPAVGTEVVLRLRHGDEELETRAKVASHADVGLGLDLVMPPEAVQRAFEQLVAENRPRDPTDEHDHVRVKALWGELEEPSRWMVWKKRWHEATLFSLTVEGAALVSRQNPGVDQEVLVGFHPEDVDLRCRATVVRHTSRGFAVRFIEPGTAFLDAVARLRRREPLSG